MSNSKKLRYEANDPPFLQKLKDQYGGNPIRPVRPPQRPRRANDEDNDDGPVYVYEGVEEYISKEEFEFLVRDDRHGEEAETKSNVQPSVSVDTASKEAKATEATNEVNMEGKESKYKQNLAEIGSAKKRKQGKVIGALNTTEIEAAHEDRSSAPKRKQRKKMIKLSFDQAEQN